MQHAVFSCIRGEKVKSFASQLKAVRFSSAAVNAKLYLKTSMVAIETHNQIVGPFTEEVGHIL